MIRMTIFVALALADVPPAQAGGILKRAVVHVEAIGDQPPFVSGIVATYVEIKASGRHGKWRTYYLPYMEEGQAMPKVGHDCRLSYNARQVRGLVGANAVALPAAPVIRRFVCHASPGKGKIKL